MPFKSRIESNRIGLALADGRLRHGGPLGFGRILDHGKPALPPDFSPARSPVRIGARQ